jgi:hypothetical protein
MRLPHLLIVAARAIDTNLTSSEMLAMFNFVRDLEPSQQTFATLPGKFEQPPEPVDEELAYFDELFGLEPEEPKQFWGYWLPNPGELRKVIDRMFEPGRKPQQLSPASITVGIENISGDPHLTRAVRDRLRKAGFPVLAIRHPRSLATGSGTAIYSQKASLAEARYVRDRLGFSAEQVPCRSLSVGFPLADVTVVLDRDLALSQ